MQYLRIIVISGFDSTFIPISDAEVNLDSMRSVLFYLNDLFAKEKSTHNYREKAILDLYNLIKARLGGLKGDGITSYERYLKDGLDVLKELLIGTSK